nr:hypothetical protein [Haloterrigena salina]
MDLELIGQSVTISIHLERIGPEPTFVVIRDVVGVEVFEAIDDAVIADVFIDLRRIAIRVLRVGSDDISFVRIRKAVAVEQDDITTNVSSTRSPAPGPGVVDLDCDRGTLFL